MQHPRHKIANLEAVLKNIIMRYRALGLAAFVAVALTWTGMAAEPFGDGRLLDATLRLDYIFSGAYGDCDIAVAGIHKFDGWAGRRVNMKNLAVQGDGQLTMTDKATGDTLYRMSFCTLFQEWQGTEEARRTRRSFENVFLVPMPAAPVNVNVRLLDSRNNVCADFVHPVDPSDILISPADITAAPECRLLLGDGNSRERIDVVIMAEGYARRDRKKFFRDAEEAVRNLVAHEPFKSMQDRFNIIAAATLSEDSGVSVPRDGVWKRTALGSHFDTFYSDRYLTTEKQFRMHDALAGLPYESIIILANTDTYGGGGIYNLYTLASTGHAKFGPVVVHEFGHSFAGLTDEYAYDGTAPADQTADVEPWQKNVTTQVDFASKWQDLYEQGVAGLVEGAAYQPKGYWRACEDCRMRTNESPEFCPVCRRAIEQTIRYLTEEL